ncbi:MAG: DUF3575 domain-containing protein [Gemmatimonadaceae bacterium]
MSRSSRPLATALAIAVCLGCPFAKIAAQSAGHTPVSSALSTNILGPLQLGPNIEYERAISDAASLGGGVRLPAFGLVSHLINDGIESGWTVYGTWRYYPGASRLRRWYVGPHVEVGRTDNQTFYSQIVGYGGTFGHRWIKPNGFSIVLGGLLGTFGSDDTWKDGSGSAGSERYLVWMLNLSLGRSW